LLYKSSEMLSKQGHPIAYVDLESFKGHHYPDVLISVLLAALGSFKEWLDTTGPKPARRGWFSFLRKRAKSGNEVSREEAVRQVENEINSLRDKLYVVDGSRIVQTHSNSAKSKASEHLEAGVSAPVQQIPVTISAGVSAETERMVDTGSEVEYRESKIDYLNHKILDYQRLFSSLAAVAELDSFLFLDDLYHIVRVDQPRLLDYFHRIGKGHRLWLKIGTIEHRSSWYVQTPQPTGLKTGDDADVINLDLTLEKFSSSKKFLSQVLEAYIREAAAPGRDELLSDGALDRLVIASGAVARDFLGIFRRSIDEARERLTKDPKHSRGDKISAEDINMATGSYGEAKREEFNKDTLDDQKLLTGAHDKITHFCLDLNKVNVFLVDQAVQDDNSELVQELVDLRLVHHVKSRVTVSSRPGKLYRALMLDVSQYTGARKRRGITMVEFWKDDPEVLRRSSLVYDPSLPQEQLNEMIAQRSEGFRPKSDGENDRQGTLEL